ncbi:Protein kinase domain-containing protein [Penicillium ucsense]|uniref:non-specific serine/threonine protein kinase n=1 Tax=Penicillium ucsense TaxID=2839758 RepID=A0A8J8VW57_9EURO|nr:Protein kinase domain-containing protein [Penicillium ucsense]KAF7729789.1 Protein kinase domain-containing protein [Penicillium ucsense]
MSTTDTENSKSAENKTRFPLYLFIEEVEPLEQYQPGGYHPVKIGDHFHSRYRVIHKLGYGSYSTIWLARDEELDTFVALKICVAKSSLREMEILIMLQLPGAVLSQNPANTMIKAMIPTILDNFTIHGPNGSHPCYVTALAMASLSDTKEASRKRLFKPDVARSLAAQLALTLDYVHAQGVVHGDLHLRNILLKVPPELQELTIEQLYNKYRPPELEPVIRLDGNPLPPGVPTHGVQYIWLGKRSEDIMLSEARLLLSDFGESFRPATEPKYYSNAPLIVSPPEARFEPEKPLSFSSDIWSLACVIWEIVAQRSLFERCFMTDDDMTREHVEALGILPPEWWNKWETRRDHFQEDGTPLSQEYRPLNLRFEDSVQEPRTKNGLSPLDAEERDAILKMVRPMLSFRPEDRPNMQQILKSEWMVKWALPEYHKLIDNASISHGLPTEEPRASHDAD